MRHGLWSAVVAVAVACGDPAAVPLPAPPEAPPPVAATVVITSHWRVRVDDSLSLTISCFRGGLGERTAVEGAYSLMSRDSILGPDVVHRQYYFEASEIRRGLVSGEVWSSDVIRSPHFIPLADWDGSYAHFYRTPVSYRTEAGARVVIHWLFMLRWGPVRGPEVGVKIRYCELVP